MKAFLSSTFLDLQNYRLAAVEALERLGNEVLKMEVFGARPDEPRTACLRQVEESDIVVGIYAHRYGFIPEGETFSITEQEFDHARQKGKPTFCFLISEEHPWPPKYIEDGPGKAKLVEFKKKIGKLLVRDVFTTAEDLAFKLAAAVGRFSAEHRMENLTEKLTASLKTADLDSRGLSRGRTFADAPEELRNKATLLFAELQRTIEGLIEPVQTQSVVSPEAFLALAQGFMAECNWLEAAHQCVEYAKLRPDDWEANFLRGVAFANSRHGTETDFASLRAYNDAIAYLPTDIDPQLRARLFTYRGAMHKRLRRIDQASADFFLAQLYATSPEEVTDIQYNLACVFALQGDRAKLLSMVCALSDSQESLGAIRGHLNDYFEQFNSDEEFLALIGAA